MHKHKRYTKQAKKNKTQSGSKAGNSVKFKPDKTSTKH